MEPLNILPLINYLGFAGAFTGAMLCRLGSKGWWFNCLIAGINGASWLLAITGRISLPINL